MVVHKLLAIVLTVALGWIVGRARWLDRGFGGGESVRLLGNAALYVFVPALMFRTSARVDLASISPAFVAGFFVPAALFLLLVFLAMRARGLARTHGAAAPAASGLITTFGNTVQVGIPVAAALFGEAGLALYLTLMSVHGLVLFTLAAVLAEWALVRSRAQDQGANRRGGLVAAIALSVRDTLLHPVVLPIVAGLSWNLAGLGLHPVVDDVLASLGSAVVPVCLLLIGLSLAHHGLREQAAGAFAVSLAKLLMLPALVLVVARWGIGLDGLPLAVVVMMAALPVGSNALVFTQRYNVLRSEASGAIVVSTLLYVATLPLWLFLVEMVQR